MQPNVPEGYLPAGDTAPEYLHAVPEVTYPKRINVAAELVDRHRREGRGDNVAIKFEGG